MGLQNLLLSVSKKCGESASVLNKDRRHSSICLQFPLLSSVSILTTLQVYSKQETAINCFATANKPSSVILLSSDQRLASQPTSWWRLNLLCLSLARSLITISDRTQPILTESPVILNSLSKQTPIMTSNHNTAAVFSVTPTQNQSFFFFSLSFFKSSYFHWYYVFLGGGKHANMRKVTGRSSEFDSQQVPNFSLLYSLQTNSESHHLLALKEGCFAGLKRPQREAVLPPSFGKLIFAHLVKNASAYNGARNSTPYSHK